MRQIRYKRTSINFASYSIRIIPTCKSRKEQPKMLNKSTFHCGRCFNVDLKHAHVSPAYIEPDPE